MSPWKSGRLFALLAVLIAEVAMGAEAQERDPVLTIPQLSQPPVIDGVLNPEEWKYAAKLSLLEVYPGYGIPRVPRQEQPSFYVCRDNDYLYVAMESIESNTNTVVAACVLKDNVRIIGDDCVEIMIAPGAGEDVKKIELPVYYFAINSIGTVWDAKFYPLLAEAHNSWDSGAKIVNSVNGTHWVCEAAIPLKALTNNLPDEGMTWRMNFDRTFSGYSWLAWNARGGFNDARIGGDVHFTKEKPVIRLVRADELVDGKSRIMMEAANPWKEEKTAKIKVEYLSRRQSGDREETIEVVEKEIIIPAGGVKEESFGTLKELHKYSRVIISAKDKSGDELFFLERALVIPAPRFVKRVAPKVPLVYVFPRFLPSFERLAVSVDYTAWVKNTGFTQVTPVADISVFKKEDVKNEKPVLKGTLKEFKGNKGVWRHSTKALPEGEYTVKVKVTANNETLIDYDDWFEKRIFDWMVNKRGTGDKVPPPFTELKAEKNSIDIWGRRYTFSRTGLPLSFISQEKSLLGGEAVLEVEASGKTVPVSVSKPFAFTETTPASVSAVSQMKAGNVAIELVSTTEYDGFTLYKLTYKPAGKKPVKMGRMRLKVPLAGEYVKFYSAAGDTMGTGILGEVVPGKDGRFYDSYNNTRSVSLSPSFATVFWVGDYETSFCYASDICKGWLLRDDAPAVEAYKEGDRVTLYLNFIDRETVLTKENTLEFAFQAGPVKPLPEDWRGIQDGSGQTVDPKDVPMTIIQSGGDGSGTAGGLCFLHPGDTPELVEQTRKRMEGFLQGGNKAVVEYHYWGPFPKGRPEARVFRSEWGIDKYTWESARTVSSNWAWENKRFGDNKDMYILMYTEPRPSYVDYIAWAYDETLKQIPISGHYDDCGYPKPVFDEELGLGYIRDDGRKVYSSGLWIYRERWKREAYANFLHNRPNFLRDSQHVHAHYMPAYGFIGIWAPCERGFYNPFTDRDNLGFYGTVERYAAFNPAQAFGQIGMIGMSSAQWKAPLFSSDTRNMMMLAMLHDQDVGSFGAREPRVVARLRGARNLFRHWEKGTDFTGYWKSRDYVKSGDDAVLVSFYKKKDGLLFILGNTGYNLSSVRISPDWKKMGLDPQKMAVFNSETGEAVKMDAGTFTVPVSARDVQIILAGLQGAYTPRYAEIKGESLKPENVISHLSDNLKGPELADGWEKSLHEGNSGVWFIDGKLCIQGAHYGFASTRKKLGVDNVSVQVLVMRRSTGAADLSAGSLFLYWANGEYVQAVPGMSGEGRFIYQPSGHRQITGSLVNKESPFGWYPFTANWVKIKLTPDKIEFYASSDGKQWIKDGDMARGDKFKGAPEYVILGNGHRGENPYMANVMPQNFNPEGVTPWTFFSDLIAGRD